MTTAAICASQEVLWSPSFYRGEQYDQDLGLYYLRARYYNPNTGRFLSRDPEGHPLRDIQEINKYLYVGGDPINAFDPTGRGLVERSLLSTVTLFVAKVVVVGATCYLAGSAIRAAQDGGGLIGDAIAKALACVAGALVFALTL